MKQAVSRRLVRLGNAVIIKSIKTVKSVWKYWATSPPESPGLHTADDCDEYTWPPPIASVDSEASSPPNRKRWRGLVALTLLGCLFGVVALPLLVLGDLILGSIISPDDDGALPLLLIFSPVLGAIFGSIGGIFTWCIGRALWPNRQRYIRVFARRLPPFVARKLRRLKAYVLSEWDKA